MKLVCSVLLYFVVSSTMMSQVIKEDKDIPNLNDLRNEMAKEFLNPTPHLKLAKYYLDKDNQIFAFYICENIRRNQSIFPKEDFNKAFSAVFPREYSAAELSPKINTKEKFKSFLENNLDSPVTYLYKITKLLDTDLKKARKITEECIKRWPKIGEFYFYLGDFAKEIKIGTG